MKLPQIRQDRANHFICGFLIHLITSLIFTNMISLFIVIFIALLKELYDEYDYGGFDIIDLIFTTIPSLLMFIITIIK